MNKSKRCFQSIEKNEMILVSLTTVEIWRLLAPATAEVLRAGILQRVFATGRIKEFNNIFYFSKFLLHNFSNEKSFRMNILRSCRKIDRQFVTVTTGWDIFFFFRRNVKIHLWQKTSGLTKILLFSWDKHSRSNCLAMNV